LVGRCPPACCSSRLPVFSLRLLQKVNGAQCQQLSLAVSLAWLKPSYQAAQGHGATPNGAGRGAGAREEHKRRLPALAGTWLGGGRGGAGAGGGVGGYNIEWVSR
jgi:hypothetical protein